MRSCLIFSILIIVLNSELCGDGKFYVSTDKIPLNEPYQQAVIIHNNNKELLIIQPKVEGKAKDFGWVIPVPSIPMVGHIELYSADRLFRNLSRITRPAPKDMSHIYNIVSVISLSIGLILLIGLFIILRSKKYREQAQQKASLLHIILLTLLIVFLFSVLVFIPIIIPEIMGGRKSAEEVEILSSHEVGIYDVKIIKSTDSNALLKWLGQNSFKYTSEDEKVFAEYIKKDWVFVTVHVKPKEDIPEETFIDYNGLIQPIVLFFDSNVPVYPYALTATSGKEVEVLIYILSNYKHDSPLFKTEYAMNRDNSYTRLYIDDIKWSEKFSIPEDIVNWNQSFLVKLRAKIPPNTPDLFFSQIH